MRQQLRAVLRAGPLGSLGSIDLFWLVLTLKYVSADLIALIARAKSGRQEMLFAEAMTSMMRPAMITRHAEWK